MKPVLLLVEDDEATRFGYSRYLSKSGYEIREAASLSDARATAGVEGVDAVVIDMVLPDGSGIDLIDEIRAINPSIPIIMVTGRGDIPLAVEAMRRGADNFLTKPVNMPELEVFLQKSIELGHLRRRDRNRALLAQKTDVYFGESPAVAKVKEMASIAATSDAPVLIYGETGTGKGVLAKWMHESGHRSKESFVEVNCSGLTGDLLASELFGHVKGAFTSAVRDKQGLIEAADGGTLFLDEIGDMDPSVQARFLKVIEEKSYRRLGEVNPRKSDFRLICATNKDLDAETAKGSFRKDLFYRVSVFPVYLPPLNRRLEDLPGFVRHILVCEGASGRTVSEDAMELLSGYGWPGNIRELKNILERALLLSRGEAITPEHLPFNLTHAAEDISPLDELEKKHIETLISDMGGDMNRAAETLGISRATLYRKIKKYRKGA